MNRWNSSQLQKYQFARWNRRVGLQHIYTQAYLSAVVTAKCEAARWNMEVNTLSPTTEQFTTSQTSGCANVASNTSSWAQKVIILTKVRWLYWLLFHASGMAQSRVTRSKFAKVPTNWECKWTAKEILHFLFLALKHKLLGKRNRYGLVVHNSTELPITDEAQMCPGKCDVFS